MGFRSVMISEDMPLEITPEFIEKYPYIRFSTTLDGKPTMAMSINCERKFYEAFINTELFIDLQKLLQKQDVLDDFELILFHECGGITKVVIKKDSIYGLEPTGWNKVESVEHDYCYGCSEIYLPPSKDIIN